MVFLAVSHKAGVREQTERRNPTAPGENGGMTIRRLAAILAADVVGFSSMMERDEEGTLKRLKTTQRDLVEPRVREHHGRIVKTTGDGFLIEFASPLDAVRCALEVQEAVSANEAAAGSEEVLRFRMGKSWGHHHRGRRRHLRRRRERGGPSGRDRSAKERLYLGEGL